MVERRKDSCSISTLRTNFRLSDFSVKNSICPFCFVLFCFGRSTDRLGGHVFRRTSVPVQDTDVVGCSSGERTPVTRELSSDHSKLG